MIIAISGTPGTGKTEVSKSLKEQLDYSLITINDFAKTHNLITGKDNKRKSMMIDEQALEKESKSIPDNTIIEGHLAHYCRADYTIILRCDPDILKKRLEKRRWPEKKIRENAESEILDIILSESVSQKNNTYELDTTHMTPDESAETIEKIINNKRYRDQHKPGNISWTEHMEKLV